MDSDRPHEHDLVFLCSKCASPSCGSCGLCSACGHAPAVEDGVVQLLEATDSFYEGSYMTQVHFDERALRRASGRWVLPFVTFGYLKAIVRWVAPGSRVLELGAAAGIKLAGERYKVTAVDLSQAGLALAPETYLHRLQANILELELVPESFDAIYASCFFEHFTPEQKRELVARLHRWLRPGGRLVLLFDTESANPLFRWFRKSPELYQRCFIEHDGHVGLEPAQTNLNTLSEGGFRRLQGVGLNRSLQHLPVLGWIEPYGERFPWVRRASAAGAWLNRRRIPSRLYTAAIHLYDLSLGRVFPLSWSRLYLGVWERT
jgi:SAM-dependent methyltransferase